MTPPPGVFTVIVPVPAPVGTVTVSCVPAALTEYVVALALWNRTRVAPVKFVPVMVMTVPTGPEVGVNDVMVGGGMTVKGVVVFTEPPGVVTVIVPVPAPLGTVTVSWVPAAFAEKTVAFALWNRTAVTPLRYEPVTVTTVPIGPEVGVKDVMVG